MIVKYQKNITIINKCSALYDEETLIKAILWFTDKPVIQKKKVIMHGKYPAVNIYYKRIQIHRLIGMYISGEKCLSGYYIHHINGNRMDARNKNLKKIDISKHQSMHNKGKSITQEQRNKTGKASQFNWDSIWNHRKRGNNIVNFKKLDATKKSNIKCTNCKHWKANSNGEMICFITKEPKNYWNRCKGFQWRIHDKGELINE